jgi:hypothetical protein
MSMARIRITKLDGDVFAEAFAAVEPELVGGVLAVHAGLQRVGVATGAQPLEHGGDQRRAQPPGRRPCSRRSSCASARVRGLKPGGSSR